jgi:hypothetical protein
MSCNCRQVHGQDSNLLLSSKIPAQLPSLVRAPRIRRSGSVLSRMCSMRPALIEDVRDPTRIQYIRGSELNVRDGCPVLLLESDDPRAPAYRVVHLRSFSAFENRNNRKVRGSSPRGTMLLHLREYGLNSHHSPILSCWQCEKPKQPATDAASDPLHGS